MDRVIIMGKINGVDISIITKLNGKNLVDITKVKGKSTELIPSWPRRPRFRRKSS